MAVGGSTNILTSTITGLQSGYYGYVDRQTWSALQNLNPGTYVISATLNDGNIIPETSYANNTGTITFTVTQTPPPANDDFANALTLPGAAGATAISSAGATKEPGEPDHVSPGGASVWWKWTAPSTGQYVFGTTGSAFDTMMAVYTGTSVSALTIIADDDDGGANHASEVRFATVSGTTYRIAVDGWLRESGAVVLTWAPDGTPPPAPSPYFTDFLPGTNGAWDLLFYAPTTATLILEENTNLSQNVWTGVSTNSFGAGANNITAPPSPAPSRFFRLKEE